MTRTADAVVVGAGVIGCSVALALARDGLSVVVVDKAGAPGQGSTSASSAIVRFNYSTFDGVALSWEAKHCWESWPSHVVGDQLARFRRTGLVMLDVDLAPRARQTALFDRVGVPYEEWDSAELARRVPGIDTGRYWPPRALDDPRFGSEATGALGALWTPDAGYVDDPALAAVNLADAAVRRGARFVLGRRVVALPTSGVALDDGSSISAPVVVNAAGPWSGALNALAGVGAEWTVSTRPMRQEVHQVPPPPWYGDGPVVADLDLGTYARSTPGGALLVGGTEPECDPFEWVADPDAASPYPTPHVFAAQVTRLARRFPSLTVPGTPTGTAGVYDVTEDWTPVYDRTEREGYFVAIGTSGNQFKNAPVVGPLMAAVVRGETTFVGEHTGLRLDLSAFSRLRPRNADSSGTVMG